VNLAKSLAPCAWALFAATAPAQERPQVRAVRVGPEAIRVDAWLDEGAWQTAPGITQLVQREPQEGLPATDAVDIRFLYDADALYVGARLSVSDPKSLQAPLGRRDDVEKVESLTVYLDTYLDRRTAVSFGVTAAGARLDEFYARDEYAPDPDFNPVWEARASRDASGWTAEMRIPFSQLRFNRADDLVFGLNVERYVPGRNEDAHFVAMPKQASGWASRFGDLIGIRGIVPPRRFELLPYAAGSLTRSGAAAAGDPFDDGSQWNGRAGLDAKIGLGGLNLDLTANPDFGQVEADPAEVNLTAFETIFAEKRPFFLEGSSLLTGEWVNYYYSRRIGATPRGMADGDFVDSPARATILGAAKLSGRLPGGWALGSLLAVTDREHATSFDAATGAFARHAVAPRAGYLVSRVQRDFGAAGSSVGLIFSGVARDLAATDALSDVYTRRAVTAGVDWRVRSQNGGYELTGYGGLSHVDGEPAAIESLQRSSARYFQRPDAGHVELDPARRSLGGGGFGLKLEKRAGRHWLGLINYYLESPELELNDVGRVATADGHVVTGNLRYRETQPGSLFHAWQARLNWNAEWNFDGDRQFFDLNPNLSLTWKNFWRSLVFASLAPRSQDQRRTRGGPSMGKPRSWSLGFNQSGNPAARSSWNVGAGLARGEDGGRYVEVGGGLALRPGPRFSLSIDPYWVRETETRQYVDTVEGGGRPETYGNRYAFGSIERDTLVAQARASFTIKPDLTVDLYAEPFAASGRYGSFGELLQPRSRDLLVYGTAGTTLTSLPDGTRVVTDGDSSFELYAADFDVRSFRSTLVLRWEWRRGSTLYAVWQQDRYAEQALPRRVGVGDLFESFSAPGRNAFLVKAAFWLPVR